MHALVPAPSPPGASPPVPALRASPPVPAPSLPGASPVFFEQVVSFSQVLVFCGAVIEVGVPVAIPIACFAPRGTAVRKPKLPPNHPQ